MSKLICIGVELNRIEKHPNADALDLVWVNDYQAITQIGRFKPKDRAIYVGEQAVVPFELLKAEGFWNEEKNQGLLAGSTHNRVKAVKLRGILSQGILITPFNNIEVDKDYSEELGIVKWEPPIPAHLAGQVWNPCLDNFTYTDIENIKNYPDVFQEDEVVICTEKLHGTCAIFHSWLEDGQYHFTVSSKGHAAKGLALQESETNFYWRIAKRYKLDKIVPEILQDQNIRNGITSVTLFGEGLGVQDLKYGIAGSDATARFFDLRFDREYLDQWKFESWMVEYELPIVPVLAKIPFNKQDILEITKGMETLSGSSLHVREGIVIRPHTEREDVTLGRVVLKSVSEEYLLRRNKDATEFE